MLRFISEAQAANQIRSRHIVDIFSFGKLPDGRHFYVMDLLEGEPLDRCLAREIRFDVPTALQLLRPIAEALDAAHAAGIVHRDLKPQNIFLACDPGGETVPKLLDFGMAKLLGDSPVHTLSGTPIGTPLYMSPEQARGDKVDGRSDVYALGVLCHELLTGRLPITGDSTDRRADGASSAEQPPRVSEVCPDLPPELDEPILHMLAKDPANRPATAGEAFADLERAAERTGHVIPPGMPRLRRPTPDPAATSANAPSDTNDRDEEIAGIAEAEAQPKPVSARGSASTTAPDPTAGSTPVLGRKGRVWPFVVAIAVVGCLAFYVVTGRNRAPVPVQPASTPVATPAPASVPAGSSPASAPSPGSRPSGPSSRRPVRRARSRAGPTGRRGLTVRGAPRGARVWIDGNPVGEVPGPMAVPFGETSIQLTITAPGHEPATVDVVPRPTVAVTVKLKKKATGTTPRSSIPSDLESPF